MLPRHARAIYDKYSERGLPTPVAIIIGVHPAIWLSAGYTTAPGIDELALPAAYSAKAFAPSNARRTTSVFPLRPRSSWKENSLRAIILSRKDPLAK